MPIMIFILVSNFGDQSLLHPEFIQIVLRFYLIFFKNSLNPNVIENLSFGWNKRTWTGLIEFCDSHDDLLKQEIKYEATELDMKENLTFGENQINSDSFVQNLNNQGENQDNDFFEDIIDYQDFEEPIPPAKRKKRKRKIKGQLISKCLFGVIVSTKTQMKIL